MFWEGAIEGISNVVGKLITDKDKAKELEAVIEGELIKQETKFMSYQRDTITAEINSKSWLARNWRPITMLTFVFIVFNNFVLAPYLKMFGAPFTILPIPPQMWTLLSIGIGGYIAGRTGEKMIKTWKEK